MADQSLQIAFDASMYDEDPEWTTITGVQTWKVDRGRDQEFSKMMSGSMRATLIDLTGKYDPTNSTAPYYGKLDPMKPARVQIINPHTDVAYNVYRGYTNELDVDVDVSGKFLTHTWDWADGFEVLTKIAMVPGDVTPIGGGDSLFGDIGAGDLATSGQIYFDGMGGIYGGATDHIGPDDRINAALDDAGWPSGLRSIFSGNVALQEAVYQRRASLLAVLLDAADAEFPGVANIFMSKDGEVWFRGRFARFNPTNPTYGINQWYVGDEAAYQADPDNTIKFTKMIMNRGATYLYNNSLSLPQGVSADDVPVALVKDEDSIGKYGWRPINFDDLLLYQGEESDERLSAVDEALLYSTYYVDNFKDPRTRVKGLTLSTRHPSWAGSAQWWDFVCRVEIGDVVNLKTTHVGGGGFDEGFYVEGLHYSAYQGKKSFPFLELTLDLSPAAYYDTPPSEDWILP